MVCNTIVNCIFPPPWLERSRLGLRSSDQRRRFAGFPISKIFMSLGADVDLITDWVYFERVQSLDNIPGFVTGLLTFFLAVTTCLWVLEVIEGRIGGFQKCFGFRLKNRHIAWAGLVFEDIPQIILTIVIDLFLVNDISSQGITNISASIHDAITRLKALLDNELEENDEIESLLSKVSNMTPV
mmetsp:Transcript_29476/g.44964  ORF Transcript_29476/g.44964 Transcript_29476/m.44964 type:complete len:184 (+) Transcript_29476:77-628(+)